MCKAYSLIGIRRNVTIMAPLVKRKGLKKREILNTCAILTKVVGFLWFSLQPMRISHVTSAIVLRTWPSGESDRIVSFLTEGYGKMTAVAKGAKRSRKRFANSLEPFSLVILRFQDRPHTSLAFLLACELQRAYTKVAGSLEKIAYASYLVEITEGLIGEREENHLVFNHLREGLTYLEEAETSQIFLAGFELRLLKLAGYQPVFDSCGRCGVDRWRLTARAWHFSHRDGGVLCASCARLRKEIFPVSPQALDLLTAIQNERATPVDVWCAPSVLNEIRSVLFRFVQLHLNKEIKSASFLHEFASF
jgi:DNA repair protein RecO (recombination protein O)